VREFCPSVVFISETRQQNERVGNIRFRVAMNTCFVVDGQGKGGGLTLYWNNNKD
jgi:hypothetical protein